MKRVVILGMTAALAMPAFSSTLFTHPNQAGGLIRLTDARSTDGSCDANERIVYSNNGETGNTIFGCWTYLSDDDMVMIRWSGNGRIISLPGSGFTATPAGTALKRAGGKSMRDL